MNLVLGATHKLDWDVLRPFVVSLRNTGYDGRIMFIVAETDDDTLYALEQHGVELVAASNQEQLESVSINCLRYFLYQQILSSLDDDVENIFIADVRDVIFQRDPFTMPMDNQLCCFQEDLDIRFCMINSWWILSAFGAQVWENCSNKKIVCSGTTLGPRALMIAYVDKMVETLNGLLSTLPNMVGDFGGIDQGVHNYLIHEKHIAPVRLHNNETGPLFTMHHSAWKAVNSDASGALLNGENEVFHVIHQYDRVLEVANNLHAIFAKE